MASAAIATGCGPDEHHIPSMNWYHRGEERYVEYGSSFPATRAFGVVRSLFDTVYNMNLAHLTPSAQDGLRAPRRRRRAHRLHDLPDLPRPHRHEPVGRERLPRGSPRRRSSATRSTAPRELFYADLFDSRETGCTSALGMPGQRDRHTGCVGAYLVEHDLFDFLLFSLPDNDTYSHKAGPDAQVRSIAEADRALERLMHVAGGVDAFLEEHAVIVMSDHSQTDGRGRHQPRRRVRRLARAHARRTRRRPRPRSPSARRARSAQVYVLDEARRDELVPRAVDDAARGSRAWTCVVTARGRGAIVRSARGRAALRAGRRRHGRRAARGWTRRGRARRARCSTRADGRGDERRRTRTRSAGSGRRSSCPHAGRRAGVGRARATSSWTGAARTTSAAAATARSTATTREGVLLLCGDRPAPAREQWSLPDVTPLVLDHFGVPLAA